MALNTNWARTTQDQAYDASYNILTRNSTLSEQVDRICNFFEWWDWARLISDEITEFIANSQITAPDGTNFCINDDEINKKALLKHQSLKDKLAFLISLFYKESNWVSTIPNNRTVVDNARNALNNIENHITENIDISQKFTIRHAATNRFSVKLNRDEIKELDTIINSLEKLVKAEGLDNYTFHFWQIKDAQKIKKVEESIRMLRRTNISEEWNTKLNTIEVKFNDKKLSAKLDKLDELDESYENMSTTLNNMYTLNRWSMQVLSKSARVFRSADIRRLVIALSILEWKDRKTFNIEDYTKWLFNKWSLDLNIELEKILTDSKIKEALKKANMTEQYFSRAYLEHFSQELVVIAKQRLDSKKREVFGTNKKEFERDVNNWKENQRQRIIGIWANIQARGGLANSDEIYILTSYLRKNKHVFFENDNQNQNNNLRVALEVAIENITPNSSAEERNLLRDTVLTQNRNINDLFYWNNNAFEAKAATDNPIHNTLNHIRRITEMTSVFSQKYWQVISKTILVWAWAMLASSIGIWAILTTAGLAVWAKYLWKWLDKWLTPYHAWLAKERKGFARLWVFPLKIAKIITWPLEKLGYWIDAWSDKIISIAKNTRTKVNDTIANKIWNKEFVKNLTDSQVNNTFSLLALWINWLFRGGSELTTLWSNVGLDLMDTHEKRRILEWIYSTENAQNLRELSEQTEIQSILQEDVGLYEKDGYVDVLKASKKIQQTTPENNVEEPKKPEEPAVGNDSNRSVPEEIAKKDIQNRRKKLRKISSSLNKIKLVQISNKVSIKWLISVGKLRIWNKIVLWTENWDNIIILINKINEDWSFEVDFLFNKKDKKAKIKLSQRMEFDKDGKIIFPKIKEKDLKLPEFNKYTF
ncbi:MAG: hypothetical protein ACD_49C00044G0014 [uncultured bacterium (gcode 4)]|uniref:Uncharacterized protein n=1 Tax=uncultured bacterium (gcode 4) TaxID=1234023 RepID=K2AXB6_9BACT|nr:MAG: hypothetical protein ACD_49C00044G0014 [uncultured bacterium (gcode 4)]